MLGKNAANTVRVMKRENTCSHICLQSACVFLLKICHSCSFPQLHMLITYQKINQQAFVSELLFIIKGLFEATFRPKMNEINEKPIVMSLRVFFINSF